MDNQPHARSLEHWYDRHSTFLYGDSLVGGQTSNNATIFSEFRQEDKKEEKEEKKYMYMHITYGNEANGAQTNFF